MQDFADDDFRKDNPRFVGEAFRRNLALADEVQAVAAEAGATPAQVALAWLLSRGTDIAPIPGTKRVAGSRRTPPPTASSSPTSSCAASTRCPRPRASTTPRSRCASSSAEEGPSVTPSVTLRPRATTQ